MQKQGRYDAIRKISVELYSWTLRTWGMDIYVYICVHIKYGYVNVCTYMHFILVQLWLQWSFTDYMMLKTLANVTYIPSVHFLVLSAAHACGTGVTAWIQCALQKATRYTHTHCTFCSSPSTYGSIPVMLCCCHLTPSDTSLHHVVLILCNRTPHSCTYWWRRFYKII